MKIYKRLSGPTRSTDFQMQSSFSSQVLRKLRESKSQQQSLRRKLTQAIRRERGANRGNWQPIDFVRYGLIRC